MPNAKKTKAAQLAADVLHDVMDWYRKPYAPDRFSSEQLVALITHVSAGKPLFQLAKVIAKYGRKHPDDAFNQIQIIAVADYLETGGQPFYRKGWLKLAGFSKAAG